MRSYLTPFSKNFHALSVSVPIFSASVYSVHSRPLTVSTSQQKSPPRSRNHRRPSSVPEDLITINFFSFSSPPAPRYRRMTTVFIVKFHYFQLLFYSPLSRPLPPWPSLRPRDQAFVPVASRRRHRPLFLVAAAFVTTKGNLPRQPWVGAALSNM